MHYLVTLGRKPGALDHSGVYRNWQLPAAFTELRTALEERHGPHAGSRQSVADTLRGRDMSSVSALRSARARRIWPSPWAWPPADRAAG